MAVIGSGTYQLRGTPDQQILVLRSVLLDAKEKGADWQLIYSAIYDVWASQRPLLPLPEEMSVQISSIEPMSKHASNGYVEEFKRAYDQGRSDTRTEIASVKSGQGMSHEYSYKIARQTMFFSLLSSATAFIYAWLIAGINFFFSLLTGFVTWFVVALALICLFTIAFKIRSKSD